MCSGGGLTRRERPGSLTHRVKDGHLSDHMAEKSTFGFHHIKNLSWSSLICAQSKATSRCVLYASCTPFCGRRVNRTAGLPPSLGTLLFPPQTVHALRSSKRCDCKIYCHRRANHQLKMIFSAAGSCLSFHSLLFLLPLSNVPDAEQRRSSPGTSPRRGRAHPPV